MPDALRIPERYREDLAKLAQLEPEPAKKMVEVLSDAPKFAPVSALVGRVAEAAGVTRDDAGRFLVAALSAVSQLNPPTWPAERVAEELGGSSDLKLTEKQKKAFVKLLQDLMSLPAVITSAKASDILTDHEHVFSDARVFTDIRSIFPEDPQDEPSGAVIVEMLKIQHFTNGEQQSFYVALDLSDLLDLKQVIERALQKTESVMARLDAANLEYFSPEED
jgi:hypothetical protein